MSQKTASTSFHTRVRPSRIPPRPAPIPAFTPAQNAMAAVIAVLAAFAAMFFVALLGLWIADASAQVPLFPTVIALVCLAVGGSVGFTGGGGGGFISIGLGGGMHGMPLGVTLVGALTFGLMFFRQLRGQRVTPPLMTYRIFAAAATWIVLLAVVAPFGHGAFTLPHSFSSQLTPKTGAGCTSGGSGGGALSGLLGGGAGGGSGLSSLLGGGAGGGLESSLSTVQFSVGVAFTIVAGVSWLLIMIGLGVIAARRPRFHKNFAAGGLRANAGPVLSSTISVIAITMLALSCVAAVIALVLGGAKGSQEAAAALLVAPNAIIALLSTGTAGPWSLSYGIASNPYSPLNGPLGGGGGGGLLSGLTGGGSSSCASASHSLPQRSMSLANIAGDGLSLHLGLLVLLLAILIPCGVLTASRTAIPNRPGETGPHTASGRALRVAARLGVLWAFVLLVAHIFWGVSLTGSVSLSSMALMNLHAGAGADSVFGGVLFGLVCAAAAGYIGSFIHDAYRNRRALRA